VPVSPAIPSLFHVTDGIAAATLVGWCSYYWTASSSQTSTLDCSASWLCPLQTSSTLQLLQLSTCIQHVRWTLQHAILTTNACPQCSRICCNKSQQERAQPCSESSCAYISLQRMPRTANQKCCSSPRLQMPPAIMTTQQCTIPQCASHNYKTCRNRIYCTNKTFWSC